MSKIALPSVFDVRTFLRDNRNVLEAHDRGVEKEDRKGKEKEEKKSVEKNRYGCCRCRCSVEVAQEKVAGLYTSWSSHEEAEHEG